MPTVTPATHGFGLFGAEFGYPGGGFCVSAFLILRHRGEVVVGQMRRDETWMREWNPNLRYYEEAMLQKIHAGLRFPGTYLRVGEAPDAAAARVWRDQLGLPGTPALRAPLILSEAGPSRRYPGESHWDIAFVYETEAPSTLPPAPARPHWERLELRALADLRPAEFVMLHGELLPLLKPGQNP